MAKSWNGFIPQNLEALEQWKLLETSRNELADAFDVLRRAQQVDAAESEIEPEEQVKFFRLHWPE